ADGTIIEWLLREESAERIKEKIEDICLAMSTYGRVTLPPVTFNNVQVEIPASVRKVYREFASELAVNLSDLFDGEIHTAANAAILTARLSQMTAGFLYVDDADLRNYEHTILHHEKITALEQIMESPHEGGVLVFYRFAAE